MYSKGIKRILDFFAALFALIFFLPIFLIVGIVLSISNNGKPFFFQKRPGKNGKTFTIIKFKTMNDKTDEKGELLPFEDRITPIGSFVRKYSLDELPQLFNIIKGDMSLIGPRPLLLQYIPLYNDFQKRRHEVRPGITGWAQINGRNTIDWDTKFGYDVWYVDNISFSLDLKILFLTIKKVLLKEGVNSGENLNMPDFMGN
ncbi:sugar transferase [Flagellimonas sp. HMM57]|uniref:sugar transferase n=1 Tax=unclassified Flagellimonas TaxID=2644544 RepID=UPI0013D7701A|nr:MULTISPECIES: sugar transferase [unclassified Flagellimonas]UII76139.1 sugar transferase [Flagellimonas sp. HMM57]